jgi:acyl-CoA dehydrogenase
VWTPLEESDELRSVLRELGRFASERLAPAVERHERPLTAVDLEQLLGELDALGVLGAVEQPCGLGLWEDAEAGRDAGGSLCMLAVLAEVNAAFALAAHQLALARIVARKLELGPELAIGLVLASGHHGLGRGAFARWLAERPLDENDRALLDDVLSPRRTRIATTRAAFEATLMPVWIPEDQIGWAACSRAELEIAPCRHAHGLDELATVELRARVEPCRPVAARPAREALLLALRAETLGHAVIALGALRHAERLALAYARERTQGGVPIVEHAAVQLLLARVRSSLEALWPALLAAAREASTPDAAMRALALRAEAHPSISDAANAALQVFGGLGYMQDVGLEKIVRDTNHLRALGVPLGESALLVAEWERAVG